jgi:4-carboxymuconolactone decarboxylase
MLFAEVLIGREDTLTVRVPPLPADQWDDATRKALAGMLPEEKLNPEGAGSALSVLVRHPELTKAFLRFNMHLLMQSSLSPRIRELAILRVAHRGDCEYEWEHHVDLGMREGITADEITRVQRGEMADEVDRIIVSAVDELIDKTNLSDATWASLTEHFDERQRMDFVFTVGCYNALAMAFNTFGVEVEEDFVAQHKKGR